MSTELLVGLAAAAGLACPAHMWWQRRRGRRAACCVPAKKPAQTDDLQSLRERQRLLAEQIAVVEEHAGEPEQDPAPARTENTTRA